MRITRGQRLSLLATAGALALAGCDGADAPVPANAPETAAPSAVPENEMITADTGPSEDDFDLPEGTPMAERVATIGLLNKRNNITRDLEMRPGEERRVEDVLIRVAACERTAPWESNPETGAFVQVLVKTPQSDDENPRFGRIFSGWLFKNSPSLNVVEHPIYDVWVKDCAMSFPGEEEVATSDE